MRIRFALPLVVTGVCCFSLSAFGQSDAENRATARALGQEGQAAFDLKDYKKSEDSFRRAEGLYHAPTLLLGLARSQVAEGQFVEAWENYNRIILDNVTSSPAFAKALAEAKVEIAGVQGRRSRVTIAVTGSDSPTITLDARPLKSEALGIAFFVDPGKHTISVTAEGFNPETRTFAVAEGQSDAVSIALARAPGASALPTAASTAAPARLPDSPVSSPSPPIGARVSHPLPSIIAFGVAGAGLGVGVIAGLMTIGKHSDLKSACSSDGTCDPAEQSDVDSYHALGAISTVGFVVAGAGALAGGILWFTVAKGDSSPPSAAWVAPYLTPGSVGAVGRF